MHRTRTKATSHIYLSHSSRELFQHKRLWCCPAPIAALTSHTFSPGYLVQEKRGLYCALLVDPAPQESHNEQPQAELAHRSLCARPCSASVLKGSEAALRAFRDRSPLTRQLWQPQCPRRRRRCCPHAAPCMHTAECASIIVGVLAQLPAQAPLGARRAAAAPHP